MKLRKGIVDASFSTPPGYNESHISVPPAAAADYHEHDSQFSARPFGSNTATPNTTADQPPLY